MLPACLPRRRRRASARQLDDGGIIQPSAALRLSTADEDRQVQFVAIERLIEHGEQREIEVAAGVQIQTAPPRPGRVHLYPRQHHRAVRSALDGDKRPTDRAPQPARNGEHGIANDLRFQAAQAGFRLHRVCDRTICGGIHDEPVQWLELPAAADEFGGKPVEQLGIGGCSTRAAEVTGSGDHAAAEMMMPGPVHDHASDERRGWAARLRERTRQRQPARRARGRVADVASRWQAWLASCRLP